MHVLATILLVLSIIKIISTFIGDDMSIDTSYKAIIYFILADGLIGLICSLFILLW